MSKSLACTYYIAMNGDTVMGAGPGDHEKGDHEKVAD
jgi:hypothetical protein